MAEDEDKSLLDKIDALAPPSLKQFDAFPKVPTTFKSRSTGGGLMTIIVVIVSFILILNDIGEFIWGWSDYEFSVDRDHGGDLAINVDMIVNTPCQYLSVDLRDAMGDRIHLSSTFTRDGSRFDVGQASVLDAHRKAQSATEVVAQSRKSRGFFSLFRSSKPTFKPTYKFVGDGGACRVYGSVKVKKVTANLHITTMGHGYGGAHMDHSLMNLSHVINEFSFGPYFPDIVQPLDYSLEIAQERFLAYQYFITVVPTSYIAPRSYPLRTHQYSVTHYVREIVHNKGTPGIFFKFDIEPLALSIHQRTTSLLEFLVRVVGVVGGVWVCFGWGFKIGSKVVQVAGITTSSDEQEIVAESSATKRRWGGGSLRSRKGPNADQWGSGSPYGSYAGTPVTGQFAGSPYGTPTSASFPPPPPNRSNRNSGVFPTSPLPGAGGFPHSPGPNSAFLAPGQAPGFPSSPLPGVSGFPSSPGPNTSAFPPSPSYHTTGFPRSPLPSSGAGGFGAQQEHVPLGPPPRASPGRSVRAGSHGSDDAGKKLD